jgi:hypothetical protein
MLLVYVCRPLEKTVARERYWYELTRKTVVVLEFCSSSSSGSGPGLTEFLERPEPVF